MPLNALSLWQHLGLKRKERCLSSSALPGSHGLNLEVERELVTFVVNELLSSEVWDVVVFFNRKNSSCLVGRGTRFFVCVWNSSWGTADLLAAGEEA